MFWSLYLFLFVALLPRLSCSKVKLTSSRLFMIINACLTSVCKSSFAKRALLHSILVNCLYV